MKQVIISMLLTLNIFAGNAYEEADKLASELRKKLISDDSKSVYYDAVISKNNRVYISLLYNKDKLIQKTMSKFNISYENAKKRLENKKFGLNIQRKQHTQHLNTFCGNDVPKLYKQAFDSGVILSFKVSWENGDEIIKDLEISKNICKKNIREFDDKREKEKNNEINENLRTIYKLGIYKMPIGSKKIEALKKYLDLKNERDSYQKIIDTEGQNLYFTEKVNYEIIQGRSQYISPFLWKGQYNIIKVIKVIKD